MKPARRINQYLLIILLGIASIFVLKEIGYPSTLQQLSIGLFIASVGSCGYKLPALGRKYCFFIAITIALNIAGGFDAEFAKIISALLCLGLCGAMAMAVVQEKS